MTVIRTVDAPKIKDLARHVVKFKDGTYLDTSLKNSTTKQGLAMRWLTWASAKKVADSRIFKAKGARAVRLCKKPKKPEFSCTQCVFVPTCQSIQDMRERHGTPSQFENGLLDAYAQGFVTTEELKVANQTYRRDWANAPDIPRVMKREG